MPNTFGPLAPVNFMPRVQRYVNQVLVAKAIARTEFRSQLVSGQSIDWPTTVDMRTQTYTPGTDLTIDDNVATSDTMLINVSRDSTWTMDPNTVRQAEDKGVMDRLASQAAFRIASDIDQRIFDSGINNAGTTQAGGTLTTANIFSTLTTGLATLRRNNLDLPPFAVLDPERVGLLSQSELANGFNGADSAFHNGFVGDSAAGFRIFMSNNLPHTVTLTMPTIPVATDTHTMFGITWTWVADAAATAEGEISIGANVAASQANFVDATNGTGTPGTSTYIDVSVADRRTLQNAVALASAFAADVSTVTSFGLINPSETFTPADAVFGTETGNLLLGGMGAVSLGMQLEPTLASAPVTLRPMETNFSINTLFGVDVFTRDANLLVNLTHNI